MDKAMTVHFIGAGPGAADLITVRGRDLIARSPVCLYAGSLVPRELLEFCRPARASSTPRRCRSTRSRPSSP
jgi:precorrin-4 methylase